MKIYLYLNSKILTFSLPIMVSGSFSFDENKDEESKLINIDAKEEGWFLYSTSDVTVISNNQPVENILLKSDAYYLLRRNDINYLIYVTNSFDNSFSSYNFKDNINLIIGNDKTCNINFNSNLIKGIAAKIHKYENDIVVDIDKTPVYINNKMVTRSNYPLKNGEILNIYGLKIMLVNDILLINNPRNLITVNKEACNLTSYQIPISDEPIDQEVKDIDLYAKENYFSKSPRIRRLIKTKEIELSVPPRPDGESKLPLFLVIGPMAITGVLSIVRIVTVIANLMSGRATLLSQLVNILQALAMLLTTLLWPILTRRINKKLREKRRKEIVEKYTIYLQEKRRELSDEEKLQRDILTENLIPVEQCLKIIDAGNINFWDKRIEQNDFLEVRLGMGDQKLDVAVNFPKDGFTIDEDELKKRAEGLVNEFKYIRHVPIGYSLYKNKITAMMGEMTEGYQMLNNIILQLITFYSYEDIKIVVFTNKQNESNWDYIKYLNHSFSNDKSIRFFASDNENAKDLSDYLNYEIQNRMVQSDGKDRLFKPYYVIICDDFSQIKRQAFIKTLTEADINLGFSLLILEKEMSKLPSKCNNFIYVGRQTSGILTNSFEQQEQLNFTNEVNNSIDMMKISKKLSNIPIEFEEGNSQLPEMITFLEMEKVGKVEQLNIMNRWQQNDSTKSLRAEVGVDEQGDLMYLDLHEKYHGPHGLIAGMTGAGKSEFIITYILSMAINYSPDDVSFILIDYKGGGLAGAFENEITGMNLPHLAGTITNLDKAEMDRTLVSIDSEIKRRQKVFNEARDSLGESTIDIYKYQSYYKEGKLSEPVPHLFIICDEFAELKAQQPDFMDNLISVARIGRSLGVHLILATQKPSGVVNEQIWSNTKFRVCLRVQDASDSKEMLKRPDAANLKQTGRFYLQVGYDEYFALGQSAWCGAKYYPSDKIVKQIDKSINVIDDSGDYIKSIQAGNNIKIEAQGEQLAAIMNEIIKVSDQLGKRANRLWLNDISPVILEDNLETKYKVEKTPYNVEAIIGEYDAPEKQEQGLLKYNLKTQGNTAIYGNDTQEKEMLVNEIIYSICKNYTSDEINIYIIDYGSESLSMFNNYPQVGGIVFLGEDEKFKNVFRLITDEIKNRKKLLINYGGSLDNYNNNNNNEKKLSQILFIINNYEGVYEAYNSVFDDLQTISRDCERYGIYLLLTANTTGGIGRRITQSIQNSYAFHLNDQSEYYGIFNINSKKILRERVGRGFTNNDGIHEFQTASIVDEEHNINEKIIQSIEEVKTRSPQEAPRIPTLPDQVTIDLVVDEITTLDKTPIGIYRESLKPVRYNFTQFLATTVSSNRLSNINSFIDSLSEVLLRMNGVVTFVLDSTEELITLKNKEFNGKKINYCNQDFDKIFDQLIEIENNPNNSRFKLVYVFYGIEKINSKLDSKKLDEFVDICKKNENATLILCDSAKSTKALEMEPWYSKVRNNTDGIWIGKGFGDQQVFRITKLSKEMLKDYKNNYGYHISESDAYLMKLIEFNDSIGKDDEEDE